ncbi:MAG: AtpZ/AtpI family protein [Actinobacteria bacterium]|nr:AtpZ/AtpI family protein [Actinomycetota bacterium]
MKTGDFLALGLANGFYIGIFMLGGYLADKKLHDSPWLTFAGLGLGIVIAVVVTYFKVKEQFRN